jgi:TldD protein
MFAMQNNRLALVKRALLDPAQLSEEKLQSVFHRILKKGVDEAEFYFQASCSECWQLEAVGDQPGMIKTANFNQDQGVGIRVISGEKTGLAYSNSLTLSALESATSAASSVARYGNYIQSPPIKIPGYSQHALYSIENPIESVSTENKIALLNELESCIRACDARVTQINISLAASYDIIFLFVNTGYIAADVRPMVRLSINVIVQDHHGRCEQGHAGGGGRTDYQHFRRNNFAQQLAKEAVNQAVQNLDAICAPAGTMPVVLGPGWPGILLHEAIGHGLEADANRKGSSAFSGRIGERVASDVCTVVDDGTLSERRGSLNIDDEGTATQRTVLIENGILKSYLYDKLNARLMGAQSTGNGRRQSYAHLPIPRMTNTFMLPGKYDPQEIIASVDKGLYADSFSGGQVDTTSGKFVFSANGAYLIEKGKLTRRVKGASLIGHGPEVLTKVSMVGHDLALDSGLGTCGKDGQYVPVGVGQPTLKIDALTVGGTET